MKNKLLKAGLLLTSLTLVLFISIAFYSCQVDDKSEVESGSATGQLQFSLGNISKGAVITIADIMAEATGVLVSITDMSDVPVVTDKYLPLYNMNGYPITGPIDLEVGAYKLTAFSVVKDTGVIEILYSTPVESSSFAHLVSDPLPIEFTVLKDQVVKLVPEVINVEGCDPTDFGYTSFSFEVVNIIDIYITAFIYNSTIENWDLTDADFSLYGDGSIILQMTLDAITNRISIPADYSTYRIVVEKPGYVTWESEYSLAEINLDCDEKCPIIVILEEPEVPTMEPTEAPTDEPTEEPTEEPTLTPTPGPGTVWSEPETQEVIAGTSFTTNTRLNSGASLLTAYSLEYQWNNDLINLDTTIGDNGLVIGADGFITLTLPVISGSSGSVRVNGFDVLGTGPGTNLDLMTLNWIAQSAGTTTIDIIINTLAVGGTNTGLPATVIITE